MRYAKQAAAAMLAVAMIAGWEGLRTKAYLDPIGIPTICYGYIQGVQIGDKKTESECKDLLNAETMKFMQGVRRAVKTDISAEELAAYTSFSYNVGLDAFRRSTLLRRLNAGDREGACNQLTRWVYAGGRKLQGLVNRREDERKLCLSGLR